MNERESSAAMGTRKLFPLLVKMSIPSVVGMIVASLYNVVDTIFVGRGAGTLAIAGLSIAFPVQIVVMALAQLLGIGGASVISRRLGENRVDLAQNALGTVMTATAASSILIAAASGIFAEPILRLFGASEATLPYALDYTLTVVWGFPFLAISMAGSNLIRAEGRAQLAAATMTLGMLANIALDPIFIFSFGMGIRGAALATVLAQGLSALWILSFYARKKGEVQLGRSHLGVDWRELGSLSMLGAPTFVQAAGMSLLTVIINNILFAYSGDLAISVFGVTNRLLAFVVMPLVGVSQGFQPIAGYNYGAGRYDRVKRVLLIAVATATALALMFYVFIRVFTKELIGIFAEDETLVRNGVEALRTMSLFLPLMGFQIIFSIYFQAVGKGTRALILDYGPSFGLWAPQEPARRNRCDSIASIRKKKSLKDDIRQNITCFIR